jgi:glycosyltransferase involved in cell wall biosynthesis
MIIETSTDGIELTIVMPCLNEALTLERCIRKARSFLETAGVCGEIVIGDNGSIDGSQEIARRHGARVVDVPIRGYGAAVHAASLSARGRFIIMGDSDDSYDFGDLMPFVEKLRDGYDLVMGNRFAGCIKPGAMPWKNRMIGNPVLSGIGRLFFRTVARDLHCGIRGYSLEALKRMDLRTTGMEFASEMVIKAALLGMRMIEVPATLAKDGRDRPPHLRPWRDGWRHLRFMLLYSPRWLFLYPGVACMLAGLVVGLCLLRGPIHMGRVTLDVHTLFFAGIAVLIGYQAILFATFSKIFAANSGLIPQNRLLDRLFDYFTLEVGLVVGGALLALGLTGSAYSFILWDRQSFGEMDPRHLLRVIIPSGVCLALGVQTILSSFFLSVLGLGVNTQRKG